MLTLAGCKKGEDDPAFSLKSRKARLEGSWKLEKGNVSITGKNVNTSTFFSYDFELTKTNFTLTQVASLSQRTVIEGDYFLKLDCTKDGKFFFHENLEPLEMQASGSWNFNKKSAYEKSKEYIHLSISSISSGQTSGFFLFNQSNTYFNYHIKELRNDKLVLENKENIFSDANGSHETIDSELTFLKE